MNITRSTKGTPTHITLKQPAHNRVRKQVTHQSEKELLGSKKKKKYLYIYLHSI